MKIPYGIADFYHIRSEGHLYVDRTARIRTLEEASNTLLFLRPRRFGKSLWLNTLACYYDLRYTAEHERLFGDLAIGKDPTPLAHRYFVLTWDFSDIDPDPPPLDEWLASASRIERIGHEIHRYLNSSVKSFVSDLREHLPPVEVEADAFSTLNNLLAAIRRTPYRLYLLVDEYDNFANEVMTADTGTYKKLVKTDGPFKRLFKWVKTSTGRPGIERLFITGVSPVVMSDVTSGLNVADNIYLDAQTADVCGFTDKEVSDLVEKLHAEQAAAGTVSESPVSWTVAEARDTMREWYNGYRFAVEKVEKVYNPTLTLYFLKHLQRSGSFPRQMLDMNLAADEEKLAYVGRVVGGQQTIVDQISRSEPLEILRLVERFTLKAMLDRSGQDKTFLASYLYYFGMLTLAGETPRNRLRLEPPNLVIEKLYIEEVLRYLLPAGIDRSAAAAPVLALLGNGEIAPLLRFVEERVFKVFGKQDYLWMDEHSLKTAFMALLFDDVNFVTHSEPELQRGHADLCLLQRPDRRTPALFDVLLEFKYVKLSKLSKNARELREVDQSKLEDLPDVKKAFSAAEGQLREYRRVVLDKHGNVLRLKAYAVVALGFERLLAREVPTDHT